MGFWIYMFLLDLLIPILMLGLGAFFRKHVPKKINYVFGYRTNRSMKNRDTWKFAHLYIGKWWQISGSVMLPISVVVMLFGLGKATDDVGLIGGVLVMAQVAWMAITIIPTERALKKNFDKYGFRKK